MLATNQLSQCTVKLREFGGQGVLVEGRFILTAVHCMKWDYEIASDVALGDYFPIEIVCSTGHTFRLGTYFLDAISDLAVLGPLDYRVFPSDCDAFEMFCDQVTALDICKSLPIKREVFSLKAWSHEGFEFDCNGTLWDPMGARLLVNGPIQGGTAGGPLVMENGELIAIVSTSKEPKELASGTLVAVDGAQPIVWRTLPEFIRERILAGV